MAIDWCGENESQALLFTFVSEQVVLKKDIKKKLVLLHLRDAVLVGLQFPKRGLVI